MTTINGNNHSMWSWTSSPRRFLEKAHDLYVQSFEVLKDGFNAARAPLPSSERVSTFARDCIPLSIQETFNSAKNFTINWAEAGATKTIEYLKSPSIREYHPEVQSLRDKIKTELATLSRVYSALCEEPQTFSEMPSPERLENLGELSEEVGESCANLRQYAEELEGLLDQPITREDVVNLTNYFRTNETCKNGAAGALEAIGAVAGGMLVTESLGLGPILPESLNPAKLLPPTAKGAGELAGFLAAAQISWATFNALAQKVPPEYRNVAQVVVIASLLGLEITGNNPLSSYLQEQLGSMGVDLSTYSATLLASYIGMAIAGTSETIGDYVRNMTFSTLTALTFQAKLDYEGIKNPVVSGIVSALAGYIGYNLDKYTTTLQGEQL